MIDEKELVIVFLIALKLDAAWSVRRSVSLINELLLGDEDAAGAAAAGVVLYVLKPMEDDELLSAVFALFPPRRSAIFRCLYSDVFGKVSRSESLRCKCLLSFFIVA